MAPPNKSKQKRPKNRPPPSPHTRKIRFRTGEYDDGNITQEFKLAKRRSTLGFIDGREQSSSIISTDGSASEYDGDGEKKIVKKKKRRKKRREVELDSITNFLIQFRILSGKSSARDKVMAFAQSFFVFRQGVLGENHNLPHIYLYYRTIEDWIKDTRKGFKLGKWIVEIEKTRSAYTTISDFIIRWLEVAMHTVAFGYHFVDNRLFISKILYRWETLTNDDLLVRYGQKSVPGEVEFLANLKAQKNQFSLVRCFLSIICETRWVLNLTNDIRVHIEEKKAYLKQLDDEKANEEIKDNIIDDHVITVRDTEEGGGGEFEDDELAIFDQKEFRLRAIRKFHFLMLVRVCCYFIMTSSKRGHLFGFRIPFIGQTWDGIFGMIGAGIAVWKNLPSVIKG